MICTIRNKILAKIEDMASFIKYLIEEYPRLLSEWAEKTDKEFQEKAEKYANGDPEVYSSIYGSFLSAFDENESREDIFYKAMLIMTYSYYESAIDYLGKGINANTHPIAFIDEICKSKHIILSSKAQDAKSNIQSGIHIIRNQLVHHNMKTKGHVNDLNRICKEYQEISYEEGELTIAGNRFILDSLENESFVLKELCEKMGYKHKKIGYR